MHKTKLKYDYTFEESDRGTSYTTTKIKTESIGENKYEYTYDVYGNIKQIYFVDSEGDKTCKYTYTYDSNNQLTAVNDKVANTYTTYTYDDSGNITRKYVQNLHPSYGYPISVQSDVAYTYTDSTWKDLLTSYNGQTITYDAIGNPLTYRDGITFTWQNGRELANYSDDLYNIDFTYDANGMRTTKDVSGWGEINYVYEGGLLLQMDYLGTILDFSYDANGTPVGFRYNDDGVISYYYYGVNSRGDIVSIYNVAGAEVVQYTYDAYGKILSEYSTTGYSTIATANPLRYRGYVYDRETGLYYLQSRYYDPVTCRFVNGDIQLNIDSFNGFNQFAYCENNPIVYADPNGKCMYAWSMGCQGPCPGVGKPGCMDYNVNISPSHFPLVRDVTDEVNAALEPAASDFALLNISTFTNFTPERTLFEIRDLFIFGITVYHKSAWDIKRKIPWEKTIGTPYPGDKTIVIYEGMPMIPAQLGNYTYGYLGRCAGYPLEALYFGSYCAAGCPIGSDLEHEVFEDWPYIELGFNFTKN